MEEKAEQGDKCPKCSAYTLNGQTSSTMVLIPGGMMTTHFGAEEWCESCGYYSETIPRYELDPPRKYLRNRDGSTTIMHGDVVIGESKKEASGDD